VKLYDHDTVHIMENRLTRLLKRIHIVFVVATLALTCTGVSRALAQGAAQPAVGIVDIKKAFDEYKETKTSNTEVDNMVKGFRTELDVRAENKLLTEAELNELIALKKKDTLTEPEKTRIEALTKLQKQRDEEVAQISNTPNATDQQKARLKELRELGAKNEMAGRASADDASGQVDKRKDELSKKITDDLKAAITKVAQAKGLTLVVDKIAVLYGGVDITDEVIKILNG